MNQNMFSHQKYRYNSPEWAITLYQYSPGMCVYIHFTYLLDWKTQIQKSRRGKFNFQFHFNLFHENKILQFLTSRVSG